MDSARTQLAIKVALEQNWQEAIKLNVELLAAKEDDIAALNRLAYAYLKSGNIAAAKSTYKKVLKFDKYNAIANKNLKWLANLTKEDIQKNSSTTPSPTVFIEEPGKTKIVTLVNPAQFKVLCNIMTTEKVNLIPKKYTIEVRDHNHVYLGALPDDLAHRLLQMIATGNEYDAYVRNVQKNVISVFLREMRRSDVNKLVPSFPLPQTVKKSHQTPSEVSDDDESPSENEEES